MPRVLMVGSGSSGKSTLLKQLRFVHGGYDELARMEMVPVVHSNIIVSIKKLCEQSLGLGVEINAPESRSFILGLQEHQEVLSDNVVSHIQTLWADSGIKNTWNTRHKFPLPIMEHADYFLAKVEVCAQTEYLPSDDDILRCCTRTTGIVELQLTIQDTKLICYDVGGQRAERKKWLHCFDEAGCILYVAGVSGYDERLVEDPEAAEHRLEEELKLFEGVCDMQSTKQIVLVLGKADVLQRKLSENNHAFGHYHTEYKGDNDYDSVIAWVKGEFKRRNKFPGREIQIFECDFTDAVQVKNMMTNAGDAIVKGALSSGNAATA